MEYTYKFSVTPPGQESQTVELKVRAATKEQADARAEEHRQLLMKIPMTHRFVTCNATGGRQ